MNCAMRRRDVADRMLNLQMQLRRMGGRKQVKRSAILEKMGDIGSNRTFFWRNYCWDPISRLISELISFFYS